MLAECSLSLSPILLTFDLKNIKNLNTIQLCVQEVTRSPEMANYKTVLNNFLGAFFKTLN